jgi:hypothetical protein
MGMEGYVCGVGRNSMCVESEGSSGGKKLLSKEIYWFSTLK